MKKMILVLLCFFFCAAPSYREAAARAARETASSTFFLAMDTAMTLTAYGPNGQEAIGELQKEILSMENRLSRTLPETAVWQLNAGKVLPLNDELRTLLDAAALYAEATGGLFDITIAPAADLWGFTTDSFRVPEQQEIDAVLPLIGPEHIHMETDTVWLDPGTKIDLGGLAKGYAVEQALSVYKAHDIQSGIANLGGDMLVMGAKPDGSPWRIGIQNPNDPNDHLLGVLSGEDLFVLTSGDYQRYFEENGTLYCHILSPLDGRPAQSGLNSVTLVAPAADGNGTLCDALATAIFIMGEEEAVRFWQHTPLSFDMILSDKDGRLFITEGLKDCFAPVAESVLSFSILQKETP